MAGGFCAWWNDADMSPSRLAVTAVDRDGARSWLGHSATADLEYAVVRLAVRLRLSDLDEAGEDASLARSVGDLLLALQPEHAGWYVTIPGEEAAVPRTPDEAVAGLSAAEHGQLPWVLVAVSGSAVQPAGTDPDVAAPVLRALLPARAGWALLAGAGLQSRLRAADLSVWPGEASLPSPAEVAAVQASRQRRAPLRGRAALAGAAVAALVVAAALGLLRLHAPPTGPVATPAGATDAGPGGLLLPDPVLDSNPGGRSGASLAYDTVTGRVVLIGGGRIGATARQDLFPDDTWAWTARGWSPLAVGSGPGGRSDPAFAFDASGAGVLFGDVGERPGQTWRFDGLAWQQLQPRSEPDPGVFASAVYDARLRSVVLVTVCCQDSPAGTAYRLATWAWLGNSWQPLAARAGPALTRRPIVAYDGDHGVVLILTQGLEPVDETIDQLTPTSRLWQFDGSSWRRLDTPVSPAFDPLRDRFGHDPAGHEMVLFQGGDLPTWTWDGRTWTAWPGAGGPAYAGGIATDQTAGHVVLFGGPDPSRDFDEVWVWAAGHWREAT